MIQKDVKIEGDPEKQDYNKHAFCILLSSLKSLHVSEYKVIFTSHHFKWLHNTLFYKWFIIIISNPFSLDS